MALIDKLRFQSVLSRGGVHEAQAAEFADVLQDTFDDQLEPLAPRSDIERAIERAVNRVLRDAADREARHNQQMLAWVGLMLVLYVGVTAIAVGILLAVLT